ncbi:MAG: aspartate/glutamate racemase family protein [Veillonellales bacterium]
MRIMVINPNTSTAMTDNIRHTLTAVKSPDTELTVTCPKFGPITIETAYDEAWATVYMLDLVKQANDEGYDAILLACFADPGLVAAREVSRIPVIGIAEATMHMACMLGAKFTLIAPRKERVASKYEHVSRVGVESKLASVRSLNMTVAQTEADPERTKARAFELAQQAAEEDGAEVIILGCAGMAGYAKEIEDKLGIVVLEPSAVGLKIAEATASLGLKHSKRAYYSIPPKKEFKGKD